MDDQLLNLAAIEDLSVDERRLVVLAAGDAAHTSMRLSSSRDEVVSLHEAGHALACMLAGFKFHSVSIEPAADGTAGRIWILPPDGTETKPPSDDRAAAFFMRRVTSSAQESRRLRNRIKKIARRFVSDNGALIMAISMALKEHREMSFAQVRQVIEEAIERMERYRREAEEWQVERAQRAAEVTC